MDAWRMFVLAGAGLVVAGSAAGCVPALDELACEPGSTQSCYSGAAATEGVGLCRAGHRVCLAAGQDFGPCLGEVTPRDEDCHTAADESCDGIAPPCAPVSDIRADHNRSGSVEMDDPTEDAGEDTWTAEHGAIFLANIDDDESRCPTTGSDAELAGCNDAADDVVNGDRDLADLAPLEIARWGEAPDDARARLKVEPADAPVRLFRRDDDAWRTFDPAVDELDARDLRAGVELRLEGKDFVRDAARWNGFVDVTLDVHGGTGPFSPLPDASDRVRLRVAPILFRHHLDPADTIYATRIQSSSSEIFRRDLRTATGSAGVPSGFVELSASSDPWAEDYFETAYTAMPEEGGRVHVLHVNFRSANVYWGGSGLRAGGRIVFNTLRGPDVGGAVQVDSKHPRSMDSLDSFGNLETIPPHEWNGKKYPLGRVLRGDVPSMHPDQSFQKMIESQGAQPMVRIDTSWLLVGHVDETLSFVKTSAPRGWGVVVNDAAMARSMLKAQRDAGRGDVTVFEGKGMRQTTIAQILDDPDIMSESGMAEAEVRAQVDILSAETGVDETEMIRAPFLHEPVQGYSLAYQPGVVNGIYLSPTHFAAPDPHGPVIGGVDIFRQQFEDALAPVGITVDWVEDWALLHIAAGEVHCGSNTRRQIPEGEIWWKALP